MSEDLLEGEVLESDTYSSHDDQLEYQVIRSADTLNDIMEKLTSDDDASLDKIDRAIDCADSIAKLIAVYSKHREVRSRSELIGQPQISGPSEYEA